MPPSLASADGRDARAAAAWSRPCEVGSRSSSAAMMGSASASCEASDADQVPAHLGVDVEPGNLGGAVEQAVQQRAILVRAGRGRPGP